MHAYRLLLLGALCAVVHDARGLSASTWCELLFKDVSGEAETIVVARYRAGNPAAADLQVVEVLRGRDERPLLQLAANDLAGYRPRGGDLFLLALDERSRPIRFSAALGGCRAISILPLRGGMLRASDRTEYDGERRPISLDELRADLTRAPAARH